MKLVFPVATVAHIGEATYGLSGKCLVKITQNYKLLVALEATPVFTGVSESLSVFSINIVDSKV